jgi:uncharacterized protein
MIRMVAYFNALLLTGFVAALMLAFSQAKASESACGGKNIMETFSPDVVSKIKEDAEKTKNGTSKLWRIEKEGVKPSWLYGTMHLADPRIINLKEQAKVAYDSADIIVLETLDILDEGKAVAEMASHSDLLMFTDGTTLSSLVSAKDFPALKAGLEKRNLPLIAIDKMKPWLVYAMLSISSCQMDRLQQGGEALDVKLGHDAKKANKNVVGLETMKDQLEAMASLPMKQHIENLVQSAKLVDMMPDVTETMIVLYTKGEISSIMPLSKHLDDSANSDANSKQFEEILINKRNITMANNAQALLAKGNAFVAVGAMHLVGDNGLVEKFRAMGYTLTSIEN